MSCILGLVVFVPAALNGNDPAAHFMHNNLLPVVNVYGLLLLSDTLLLNAFGLDRGASQAYFVMPLSLDTVLKAKNLTAIAFVALQSARDIVGRLHCPRSDDVVECYVWSYGFGRRDSVLADHRKLDLALDAEADRSETDLQEASRSEDANLVSGLRPRPVSVNWLRFPGAVCFAK